MPEAYIVAAVRSAGGRRNGRLRGMHPVDLAAKVLDEAIDRSGVDPALVEDVMLGCVTLIGEQSHNIARNAVMVSKLPENVPGVTLDRACGSSQQALHFAAQAIMAGSHDVVVAGGVESMTRAPMMSAYSLAAEKGLGGPISAGLESRRPGYMPNQFAGAELMGKKYGLTKEQCDAFSLESHRRAMRATEAGSFKDEIMPIEIVDPDGLPSFHKQDEGIRFDATIEAIAGLKLLQEGGMITAGSSSQICDGASAVVVVNEAILKRYNLTPLARLHYMGVVASDPVIMLEGPIPATERALAKTGLAMKDIDLYEVNEAFATVPLAWMQSVGADYEKLNVNGGAIALGHPMGASGAKLATTLIHALRAKNKRYGLQTMCEAGGMANVTIFEAL